MAFGFFLASILSRELDDGQTILEAGLREVRSSGYERYGLSDAGDAPLFCCSAAGRASRGRNPGTRREASLVSAGITGFTPAARSACLIARCQGCLAGGASGLDSCGLSSDIGWEKIKRLGAGVFGGVAGGTSFQRRRNCINFAYSFPVRLARTRM
jgi:hypothetical protein